MTRKKRSSLYKDGHRNAIYNTGKLEKSQKFNNSGKAKVNCSALSRCKTMEH